MDPRPWRECGLSIGFDSFTLSFRPIACSYSQSVFVSVPTTKFGDHQYIECARSTVNRPFVFVAHHVTILYLSACGVVILVLPARLHTPSSPRHNGLPEADAVGRHPIGQGVYQPSWYVLAHKWLSQLGTDTCCTRFGIALRMHVSSHFNRYLTVGSPCGGVRLFWW